MLQLISFTPKMITCHILFRFLVITFVEGFFRLDCKNAPLACSEPTGPRWARRPNEWLSTQLREIICSEFHEIESTEDNWELEARRNVGLCWYHWESTHE